jgi:hypothetical protein
MSPLAHDPIVTYYVDAATWAFTDHTAANGDEFFKITLADRLEWPELANTFGVQLTPTNRLILHPSSASYLAAMGLASGL